MDNFNYFFSKPTRTMAVPTDTPLHQPEWLGIHQPSVGRYILGPILGMGGAGEVREAWDVVLCRTVALKVLRKMEPVGLIRFMHEAQIQSRVVHPNICRIYDVDNSGGVPKIAMQLVRGPTLAREGGKLSVQQIVVILAKVAEAIHAAHRLNLVHRDLKPSNILLEPGDGGTWNPLVCDFGLAMALDEPSITLGPGLIGTPAFMAPEQLSGDRQLVGPATDVYALGATLHYALFGDPPPAGELKLHRQGVFSPERSPVPDLPRDLEIVLRKCLEKDPRLRYASALALAEDLWLFSDDAPIQAREVGPLERHWRRLQRYRILALALLLAGGGLLAGRLLEMGRLNRAHAAQTEANGFFLLEAAELEKEVRLEKMLPIHDLRPMRARVQARMARIGARMATLGPGAQGPGHYALGCARIMLVDYVGARVELEQAWAMGYRTSECAWALARALVISGYLADHAAFFSTGKPSPDSAALARRAESLLLLGGDGESSSIEFREAMSAFIHRDWHRAADRAGAAFRLRPWRYEAAVLESLALGNAGQDRFRMGDLAGAEADYRRAMAAAQQFITLGHSDPLSYYAYFRAASRLAGSMAARGKLSPNFLDDLRTGCRQALELDPQEQSLQDDWVQLGLLKADQMQSQGRDPGPLLEATLAFLHTWGRQPLTAEFRADRMLLHLRLAERNFRRGRASEADLLEAMADLGHTVPFQHRDFLGDVLNFKARFEAGRGLDPRPTLNEALERMRPVLQGEGDWTLWETNAESWQIRSIWEAAHGLDARGSLRRCQGLVELCLKLNPHSSAAHALKGMNEVISANLEVRSRPYHLAQARSELLLAQNLGSWGPLTALLQQALAAHAPGRPG